MKRSLFTLLFIITNYLILPQSVQVGISNTGGTLIISAKPDADISGNYSAGVVTIRWSSGYTGVVLSSAITSSGVGAWNQKADGSNAGYNYSRFNWTGSEFAINWTANTIHELFRVNVSGGTVTGTFELAENGWVTQGDWYFELGGVTKTNTSNPFFQQTVNDVPLPVELTSFTALFNQNIVNLKWQTKTELNNYGFEVYRKVSNGELKVGDWEKIGFVLGNGNSSSPKDYFFKDKNPSGGSKFIYRLKQMDYAGNSAYSDEVKVELIPEKFNLFQNYPNPFNPVTNIKFALPKAAKVTLLVYNLLGEKVAALLNEDKEAGFYDVQFNASNFSSGVYIYRLTTEDFIKTMKMNFIK